MVRPFRIGIDFGGTKIAITVLDEQGDERFANRIPTAKGDYAASIAQIGSLVGEAETHLRCTGQATIGIAMPGSISPATGRVQNANSTWLNGRAFDTDLTEQLGRPVRFANDANCFALSEAADGAGRGAHSLFGVILGTGCGGGLIFDRRLIDGPRGIAGEWGHTPLPWPKEDEMPGPLCWCGLRGCMETWVSGPALYQDYLSHGGTGRAADALEVSIRAQEGELRAREALDRHASRLARGLAVVVNVFDPEVIVLGGGLSGMRHLYDRLPALLERFIFSDNRGVTIRPPVHGDASGARGAARLWDSG